LPFALPDLGEAEYAQVKETLESGWLTSGPKVWQFEEEFARAVKAKHAIAVNSCTAAMHLALEAIRLEPGDEVITTPYTFAASAEVIRYFDALPVFVDVNPLTLNMRPDQLEAAITSRTRAIVPVHIGGMPASMDMIMSIARRHHIAVIEDAAHAFPCEHKGQTVGSIGDFTCFSFYATKTLTTGEGGMITTEDDAWAERCRIMSLHGISKDAWKRYTAEGSWYYEILAPGYKYNMTDVAAGLGIAQLTRAEQMWERRREIAAYYTQAFEGYDELQVPYDQPNCKHAWHLYMLRLNLNRLRIDRADFIKELKQRNIGASVHFIPLHIHPYYREMYGYRPGDYPTAYAQYRREVSLPIYSRMTDQDVCDVTQTVLDIVEQHRT
jgi:dTDP-4-amino-4,6-dideoxygalactose transaminase